MSDTFPFLVTVAFEDRMGQCDYLQKEIVEERVDDLHKRIGELEIENKDLETENEQLQEAWVQEFKRRGTEVALVKRQKALLAAALMRVRDECKGRDVLLYEIARDALENNND